MSVDRFSRRCYAARLTSPRVGRQARRTRAPSICPLPSCRSHGGARSSRTGESGDLLSRSHRADSFVKTPSGWRVVDLSALIQRRSQLDDQPPAPPPASLPVPLRWPPPARLAWRTSRYASNSPCNKRTVTRLKLRTTDRLFRVWLARVLAGWRPSFVIVFCGGS